MTIGMMSMFPKFTICFFIFITQVGFIGLTVVLFQLRSSIIADLPSTGLKYKPMLKNKACALTVLGIFTGLASLYVMGIIVKEYKRFERAFQIIDLSADFIFKDTKRLLLVPALQFVVTIIVLAMWVGAYAMILSLDKVTPNKHIA